MDSPRPEDARGDSERIHAAHREIERLTKLRQAVARGLLEVSEAAKRDAERLLSGDAGVSGYPTDSTAPLGGRTSDRAARSNSLLYGSFAFGLLCGFVLAVLMNPSDAVTPISEVAEVMEVEQSLPPATETSGQPEPPDLITPPLGAPARTDSQPAPTVPRPEDPAAGAAGLEQLVLTLTTRDTCWLSTSVDGAEPLERLLPPGRTVRLQVQDLAVLRIGNAAAISIMINGWPVKALGAEGQVVTLRITPANFETFLG